MRVRADRDVCIGSGLCALRLPEMFDQSDDDGTVVLLRRDPDPDQEAAVLDVVEACPSGALQLDR
ncbi:ferredoxin [Micromonospora halophytica]|uniref:Ferredoxin n=1 Tax=Micromonospora halophytica TaxID=47864 RepID=A0A1C5HJR4_9ACTN|nr:(4Fe-4S)-binding protein [Micromonospora halophytica]SCG46272.1 ferredoxin [Micromonospora halophytica]